MYVFVTAVALAFGKADDVGWQITSQEQHLHVGAADSVPGFDTLTHAIAERFGAPGVPPAFVTMNDWNADWDTIYPFSAVSLSHSYARVMCSDDISVHSSSHRTN